MLKRIEGDLHYARERLESCTQMERANMIDCIWQLNHIERHIKQTIDMIGTTP
jgi:hypothetical protein